MPARSSTELFVIIGELAIRRIEHIARIHHAWRHEVLRNYQDVSDYMYLCIGNTGAEPIGRIFGIIDLPFAGVDIDCDVATFVGIGQLIMRCGRGSSR